MDRVSTASGYQAVLVSLMSAETAQNTAEQQISTGKIANDLSGYGAAAATLTASRSLQSRITADLARGSALTDQLSAQDQALTSVSTAAQGATNAVTEALATGDGTTLMTTLQSQLSLATSALNTQYDGQYLFSGGQTSTPPVAAASLSDLSGGAAAVFKNGSLPQVSRLSDSETVTTGVLASAVGLPLFTALSQIQAYDAGPNGPLSGTLTAAQTSFLQGVVATLQSATSSATAVVAGNGVVQDQVKASQSALTAQSTTLTNTLGDLTDADAAAASTNLQLAQSAIQASAQVFSTLKNSSLLNFLTNG
jgi:flagellar hook-associated protein 3 FlgL